MGITTLVWFTLSARSVGVGTEFSTAVQVDSRFLLQPKQGTHAFQLHDGVFGLNVDGDI